MLSALPPPEDRPGWSTDDVAREANWILVSRMAIAGACLAAVGVAVMACGLAALDLVGDADFVPPLPSRLELWSLFQLLVVDLAMTLFAWLRTRSWLARVRARRLSGWRLVSIDEAHVPDDLAHLERTERPQLALVRDRAGTYRQRPRAVAAVPE